MKLLERENVAVVPQTRRVAAPRSEVRQETVVRPDFHVRARVVTRPKARRKSALGGRVATFLSVFVLTYVFSTLAGYVTLEGARQSARRGIERATFARAEAKEARASIEALTNPATLRLWADNHGFVDGSTQDAVTTPATKTPAITLPSGMPKRGGLLARR